MAGKPGRSGRRSLSVEVERSKIRDLAWQRTNELMSDSSVMQHGLPKVVAIAAVQLVKADMAKPIVINNDNSSHTHLTTVEITKMSDVELIDFLTGRANGTTIKSA